MILDRRLPSAVTLDPRSSHSPAPVPTPRSAALFTLAADVPAAILAKTLGIHVQDAIQWQKISAGTGPPTPPTSAAEAGCSPFRHVTKRRTT
jgi:hypothetical protein